MSTYPQWVDQRLLQLINTARTPEDISDNPALGDDPQQDGKGYFIGATVAKRIIEQRQSLPRRRYQTIEELLAIEGLGADKLADLRFSLNITAAQYYEGLLRDGILFDNWELSPRQFVYKNAADFAAVVGNHQRLKEQVIKLHPKLSDGYIERYQDAHLASFQLAFWWYLFDQDNWFSFAKMQEVADRYLSYHGYGHMDLALLKLPEEHGNWSPRQIAPVVLNRPELTITVWQAVLND